MHTLFLGLGSNQGHRFECLQQALRLLQERVGRLVACSDCVETKPVGFDSANVFLNAVVQMETPHTPQEVLRLTQEIEVELGRTSKSVDLQYADRTLDIDLLTYDHIILNTPDLTLPHPRMHERLFVLGPLVQIAPEAFHPTLELPYVDLLEIMLEQLPHIQHPQYLHVLTPSGVDDGITADINELLQALSPGRSALSKEALQRVVASQQSKVYVYYNYGVAIGTFTLVLAPAITGSKAWVEDVAVVSRHQGKGYGRKLVSLALQEARNLGATTLQLTSNPKRLAANKLYKAMGFEKRQTNVYRIDL